MNCLEMREHLSDLLDEQLDAAQRGHAEAHLADCARCSALVRRSRAIVTALGELASPAPENLAARVLARVPRAVPESRPAQGVASGGWGDLRRVAGWGLVLLGVAWQAGGGDLAGRALGQAAPMIAEARVTMEKTRQGGIANELERTGAGVAGLARGFASARRMLSTPAEDGVNPGA